MPTQISPEDFEKQLDESELQTLVDRHSQKSKRDAARQIARLQTDRRLLRSQADSLNTRKWLPPELMEEILDVIVVDGRSVIHSAGQDNPSNQKPLSEEDLTIKLWILQQTLDGAGFHADKVKLAVDYILAISDKVTANKDSVWGLEESLEWLARECSRDQLPDYEKSHRKLQSLKPQTGMFRSLFRYFVFLAYKVFFKILLLKAPRRLERIRLKDMLEIMKLIMTEISLHCLIPENYHLNLRQSKPLPP